MLYKGAKVFIGGKFMMADFIVEDGYFTEISSGGNVPGSYISTVELKDALDYSDKIIIPGFVELHSHGCMGHDFTTCDLDSMIDMCKFYVKNGITSVLATTMTIDYDIYKTAMKTINTAMETEFEGSRIIGINMEGPFLGADRKGAHDTRYLLPIDNEKYEELNALSGDRVRIIDLDPNLSNSIDFIKLHRKNKVISLAHTSCDYDKAMEAINAGATHITHLFNAMNGLHHREPGIVGALSDSEVYAEMICDGIHIHPSVIRFMFKAVAEKLILISDSMSAAGLEDGEYELGGQKVTVVKGKATLEDGTIAGSTTTIYKAFKNVISFGVPVEEAILSATLYPAKAIHEDQNIGSIAVGKHADFIVMDKDYNILEVFIDGKKITI
jgi:N-acetylglucosamine-6-phosphate deacetylase